MIRDPEIAALGADLERIGAVVAPHRDHLCVRLPLFASVRVRVDDRGRLSCEPMFGPLPRTRAFLLGTTTLTALAGAALYTHADFAPIVAFVAVMSGLGSVCRFVLTENCITRVQMLWAARQRGGEPVSLSAHASVPAIRAVEVPPPDLPPPQLVAAERRSR
jgi:hypothetical protein